MNSKGLVPGWIKPANTKENQMAKQKMSELIAKDKEVKAAAKIADSIQNKVAKNKEQAAALRAKVAEKLAEGKDIRQNLREAKLELREAKTHAREAIKNDGGKPIKQKATSKSSKGSSDKKAKKPTIKKLK